MGRFDEVYGRALEDPQGFAERLDRALVLYRDVLGMQIAFIKDSEPDSYSYPVFEIDPRASLRFAVLSTEKQERVMALTEIKGVELPKVQSPRRSAIVLNIDDVDGVVQRATRHGFFVYDEERLETQDGRIGREVGIVDQDDNLVVIYNITQSAP